MRNLKLLFVLACASILFVSCGEENYEMLTRGGDYPAGEPDPTVLYWEVYTCHQYNALGGYVLVDIKTNGYGVISVYGSSTGEDWASIAVPNSYINPIGIMLPKPKWVTLIDDDGEEVEVFTHIFDVPSGLQATNSPTFFKGNHQYIIKIEPNYDSLRYITVGCGPLAGQLDEYGGEPDATEIYILQNYSPYRLPNSDTDTDPDPDPDPDPDIPPYSTFNEYGGFILLDIKTDSNWFLSFSGIGDWLTLGIPNYYVDPEEEIDMYVFTGPYGEEATTYCIPTYTQTSVTSGTGNAQYLIVLSPNDTGSPREFSFSLIYAGLEENEIVEGGLIIQNPIRPDTIDTEVED